MTSDYRDLALEQLAADEQHHFEQLARVEDERDCYRELLHITLQQLHTARDQQRRVVDENRRLRAQLLTKTWEAA